jgi:predicted outer membrane repeat protein
LFQNNSSVHSDGGGLNAQGMLSLTGTQFLSNLALFPTKKGGGAYVAGAATLNGGLFQNNRVDSGGGNGGGLYTVDTLTLAGTRFLSNTAFIGGGAFAAGEAMLYGGLFQNNIAGPQGGGLDANGTLTLTGTQFISNTADSGGGVRANGAATLNGGLFQNNVAGFGGGGLYVDSALALTATQFLGNNAGQGGGVYHNGGTGRAVNALFARNVAASAQGAAMFLHSPGSVEILYTTIASPTVASGEAIHIFAGTVGISDTIVASYTTGITVEAGTAYENYNLFFGNGTAKVGTSGGTNDVISDTAFFNPPGDDYQLTSVSAAIDKGTDVGVTTDFDGGARPFNSLFDIGYDEYSGAPTAVVLEKMSAVAVATHDALSPAMVLVGMLLLGALWFVRRRG